MSVGNSERTMENRFDFEQSQAAGNLQPANL